MLNVVVGVQEQEIVISFLLEHKKGFQRKKEIMNQVKFLKKK